ncbi:MAG TPA: hypothetical protein VKC17_12425 [Sphingomicrobium sp.]|nr:hypothetical protein [Sphingomicrobium sp.]
MESAFDPVGPKLIANRDAFLAIHDAAGARLLALRDSVRADLAALDVSRLLALDSVRATFRDRWPHSTDMAPFDLSVAAVLKRGEPLRGAALEARSRRAALNAAHLEAAAARRALHLHALAAAAILGTESASASTAARSALNLHALAAAPRLGIAAATRSGCGAIAAISTAMLAGPGARRHRNRQSGDASGKKQPGHAKSPSQLPFQRAARPHVPPLAEPCSHSGALV